MHRSLRIGIIGDFNPGNASHLATNDALHHSASALSIPVDYSWIPTQVLEDNHSDLRLEVFDGLFCAPGSPYTSMDGALKGIQFARKHGRPFVGT